MNLWAYVNADGHMILLRAPTHGVALRQLNLILKVKVTPEDQSLVEIPKTWMGRLEGVHEDAVYDTMAEETQHLASVSLEEAWGECL